MIEDGLREGLTTGGGSEIGVETEGFGDGQVCLHGVHGRTDSLFGREDVTSSDVQTRVDTTLSRFRTLDLDQEHGFLETGSGQKLSGKHDSSGGRHDLTGTSMDGIGVEGNIHDVESNTSQVLLGASSLLGSPLETGDTRVLDFVQVLDGLGGVNHQVGSGGFGTETPNLSGLSHIPSEFVGQQSGSDLEVVSGSDLAGFDGNGKLLVQGQGVHPDSVVLVLRLGQGGHRGLSLDGLLVTNDGVGPLQGDTGVVVFEIVQTNLQVQFTGTGDDHLSSVRSVRLHTRVRLGQSLQTFDQLGQVSGVLALDGDLDDGRDGELHDSHVMGGLGSGQGTRLEQELVDTNQTDNVTGGDILDGFDVSSHHEDGSLNGLDELVLLLTGDEVGSLDSNLRSGLGGTGEDSTESVESTLVGSGNHLGDVDHQGTLGVTVSDSDGGLVVHGTFVQGLDSVSLGGGGRRQVDDNHFQHGLTSGQELSHNGLEEGLTLLVNLVLGQLDLELFEELGDLVLLEVHDGGEDSENGVQNERVEGSLQGLAISVSGLCGPLLGLGVEVVVSPKLGHQLALVNTELLGVSASELSKGESPTVQTGGEGDGTLVRVDLDVSEGGVGVSGDNDVDGLDGSAESLVEVLLGNLQLEQSSVDLVDTQDGLDSLGQRLSQYGLGLDTDTFDTVDNDQGTIGDSEGGSDFGREIDVTGGIDQVDQELVTLGLLLDVSDIVLVDGEVHGDGGRLDGDTSLLLVISGVGESHVTGLGTSDNTSLGDLECMEMSG